MKAALPEMSLKRLPEKNGNLEIKIIVIRFFTTEKNQVNIGYFINENSICELKRNWSLPTDN